MTPDVVIDWLRWIALALTLYLVVIGAAGVAARLIGAHVIASALDRVTPALMRRLVGSVLGAALTIPSVVHAQEPASAPVVMHRLDDATATTSTTTEVSAESRAIPPESADSSIVAAPAPVSPPAPATTWTVRPGENFWSIAETVLTQRLSRHVSDTEIARFWVPLIELNRSVLRDPGNPDLIYPAQVFQLPLVNE